MSLTYKQFEEGSAITNGIEDIRSIRNIGYTTDGKYWWVESDDNWLKIYSAPDFTTTKTLEHTYTLASPHAYTVRNTIIRVYGDVILAMTGYKDLTTIEGIAYVSYSSDAGATWTDRTISSGAGLDSDMDVVDFYVIGTTYYALLGVRQAVTGDYYVQMENIVTSAGYITTANRYSAFDHIYAGVINEDEDVVFYIYDSANSNYEKITFDTGALTYSYATSETLAIATNFDNAYQQYWKEGNTEILMDLDYMRVRYDGGDWAEYASVSAPTSAVSICWGFDNIKIEYIIWDEYIWDITQGGSLEKIQEYSGDAYIGYEDWFCDGTNKWEIGFTDLTVTRGAISKEALKADRMVNFFAAQQPFTNQFIHLYLDGEILYKGRVEKDKNNGQEYEYIFTSGVGEDMSVNIVEDYSTKTLSYIVGDIVDTNFNHIWHGRGTNAKVDTFVSGLTGWTNVDTGSCVSSYLSEKIFKNAYNGTFENFQNILKQDDVDASRCTVIKDFGNYTVFSTWMATTDNTKISYIAELYESTTRICYAYVDNGVVIYSNGASTTSSAVSITNDEMNHYTFILDNTAETYDLYVNGVIIADDIAVVTTFTSCDIVRLQTHPADNGYVIYRQDPYVEDSLEDAMNTLDSISPLLSTTIDKSFKGAKFPAVIKWAARYGGYIASFTPDYQLYLGEFAPSGEDISEIGAADYGFREVKVEEFHEKFSLVRLYGGYVAGEQLVATGLGEPNFGYWQDTFATVTDIDELEAMVTEIISKKNVDIVAMDCFVAGKPIYRPGTQFQFTSVKRGITDETYNVVRVSYDIRTGEQGLYTTDSYWLPDAKAEKSEETQRIDETETRVENNEQNIGALEDKVETIVVGGGFLPTDGTGVMDNSAWLSWRNAADSGDVDAFRVDGSDILVLGTNINLSSFYIYNSAGTIDLNDNVKIYGTLDMDAKKIINMDDGTAATDAMAFGQLATHTSDVDAHHAATVAYDLLHNELSGLNDGDSYEHITQTQKDALHAAYTDADAEAVSINNLSEDGSPSLGGTLDVLNYKMANSIGASVGINDILDMNTHKIINVVDGVAATDAVSKGQMDTAISAVGSNWPTSSNKRWVPINFGYSNVQDAFIDAGNELYNVGATDFYIAYKLTLPAHLDDGKALHVDQIRYAISQGDPTDYIDRVIVYGLNEAGLVTSLEDEGTNYYTPLDTNKDITLTTEYSGDTYVGLVVRVYFFATSFADIRVKYFKARFWYE